MQFADRAGLKLLSRLNMQYMKLASKAAIKRGKAQDNEGRGRDQSVSDPNLKINPDPSANLKVKVN
jgi:hypothetical protein